MAGYGKARNGSAWGVWNNSKSVWEVPSFRMRNGSRYYTADEDGWLKIGKGEGYVISKDDD